MLRSRSHHVGRSSAARSRRLKGERGAAMVEFALILPIVIMIALGILSGGTQYQRKLSLSNGSREGARYAATLPLDNFASLNAWLDDVATVAAGAADDGLPTTASGRVVCVAYVYPNGTSLSDRTTRRQITGTASPVYSNSTCFSDSRPANERRVQVLLERSGSLDAGFVSVGLTLTGKGVARFEASLG